MMQTLPIDGVLPELVQKLEQSGMAVLQAPPGAGKTTRVPLSLLDSVAGRIVMLEPRRLAARTAAVRMAQTLNEPVGRTVGYRVRGDTKVSKDTRIEVVTEGILTRMIQSDPSLDGIGAVIFDEFHERSLNADLGLALTLEVRGALRDDLRLLVMSATLDAEPVAQLMGGAPLITSEGRSFPVDIQWLERPVTKETRFETAMTTLIEKALNKTEGGVLAFLPGEGEIRRVITRLSVPKGIRVLPLFGAMPFKEQQAAIAPIAERKLVLATSIAETSLTIPDIRVVVDGGLARRARFDPGSGMSRLVTERASRAEATQRAGRAGRVAAGMCLRLWTKGSEGMLPAYPPAEIETADLSALALELAEWGSGVLPFLTIPPDGALSEARSLLRNLGALTDQDQITDHGRGLARLPLHPRLGHMLIHAGACAAPLAALLAERDPLPSAGVDLSARLNAIRGRDTAPSLVRIRAEAKRLAKLANSKDDITDPAEQAALAYPDRIGLRRPGDAPRWLLSGGKGAKMDPGETLANARLLVVTDTDGDPREARIRQAIPITESAIRSLFSDIIQEVRTAEWSRREGRVVARIEERLGAIALASQTWRDVPQDVLANAMLDGVRELGLLPSAAADRFRARVRLVQQAGHDMPVMDDETLMGTLPDWLLPYLDGVRTAADWRSFDVLPALRAMLTWDQQQTLDQQAPASFETPLGRSVAIDYDGADPEISVRLQEMFGVTQHPVVAGRALRVTLLSPAQRPLQTTMDLPGFWITSYADVRKDMRGRYPKHPWPEDPTKADPTLRAKRRT